MKRLSALLLVILTLILCSCKGLSPFFKGGKTTALVYCGDEGETVIFVDVKKARDIIVKYAKLPSSVLSRFRDVILVDSKDGAYGIVEGNVPLAAKKIILKKLGASKVKKDGLTYYKTKMSDTEVFFDLVYPGVILFSLGDYKKAYENFVSKRTNKITTPMSSYMQGYSVSVHGIKPSNDNVGMFKDSVMKATLITMDFDAKNDRVILNGIMQFSSQSAFNTFRVSMQNNMMKYSKEFGISKMELINSMRYTKFLEKEQAIVYDNYNMPIAMMKLMMVKDDPKET